MQYLFQFIRPLYAIVFVVIVALIVWALWSVIPTNAQPAQTLNSNLCSHIDWYNAPTRTGKREWVASYEGAIGSGLTKQEEDWRQMTDTQRAELLAACGKVRP